MGSVPVKDKGGRSRRWGEISDQDAGLTAVRRRRKEGEMGRKHLGLQHSSQKGLAKLTDVLGPKSPVGRVPSPAGMGLPHYTLCALSVAGNSLWEVWPQQERGGGSRGAAEVVSQSCCLQREV